ncbi:4Fe-4S dicluster domain-containing protein [Ferribacterium limneticum]|uniref:4Fe-4S dicluster domain-containing protein n=1 Tax=Ferribacterium limneticum TaxID=76259 RepID=UPI001CFA2561|nr:4Fe-4S dicluster domain-containing protein [Ferribacterium limneticum]UCV17774.1 oxidoreductase [Ferribacterium limneticum]
MSAKWNLIVDVASCSNCGNCVLAVKDEYVGNDFPGYSAAQPQSGHKWLWVERVVRGSGTAVDVAHVPMACNHCDDAPCQKAAPDAVTKRDDGIVIFDPIKAVGRRDLVEVCPYGAVSWNSEKQLPQIWPFDAHLLDAGWSNPRGVQVCPTECLSAVKITDAEMALIAKEQELTVLKPGLDTKPRIYYRNLWRAQEHFIAGNVVGYDDSGREANLAGIEVFLFLDGVDRRTVRTDVFGDFKFDRLRAGQKFELGLGAPDELTNRNSGVVEQSVNLGQLKI